MPSEEECLRILREEGTRPVVIRHCCTVKEVAVRIAERCDADLDLVKAGALLHDIGRSRTHGVGHAVEGARIARE
ncbi:MAG: HDIG domain-containing protein, partial [Euryarchaeota archaeon]|nr:HDIG domain-containing protein [Euryarchaeota archaeon]